MAITVDKAQISYLSIKREDGQLKLTGSYELLTPNGTVLAKQSFNGYSEIELRESPETLRLRNEYLTALMNDLNASIGLA